MCYLFAKSQHGIIGKFICCRCGADSWRRIHIVVSGHMEEEDTCIVVSGRRTTHIVVSGHIGSGHMGLGAVACE